MRYSKLLTYALTALAVAACGDDDGITPQPDPGPAALVRFINAVPDTGTVDLRFVDEVENLPTLLGVPFRGTSGFYQRVDPPGSRAVRLFPNATDPALTSIRLVDTTLALNADTRYTLVYAGRASASAPAAESDRLVALEDPRNPPTPAEGRIAFQALNVAVGMGPVDIYIVPVSSTTAATPADWQTNNVGVLRNVAFLSKAADYLDVPVRPTTGLRFYRFVVTPAGGTTPIFAVTPNQPGVAAGPTYGAQPGVQISGSVFTVAVVGGATPGTRQATTANQSPTVVLMSDRALNP